MEGQQEKHVMAGSPVQLKCYINNCLKQPSYVFWWVLRDSAHLSENIIISFSSSPVLLRMYALFNVDAT